MRVENVLHTQEKEIACFLIFLLVFLGIWESLFLVFLRLMVINGEFRCQFWARNNQRLMI